MEALTGVLRPPAHSERSELGQPGVESVLCQLLSSVSDDDPSAGRRVCPVCHLWGGHTSGKQRCLVSVCFPPAEDTALGHTHSCPFGERSPFHVANCCQLEFEAKLCWAVELFGCLTGDTVSQELLRRRREV